MDARAGRLALSMRVVVVDGSLSFEMKSNRGSAARARTLPSSKGD